MASLEQIKKAVDEAKGTLDRGLQTATESLGQGAALANVVLQDGYSSAVQVLDQGKEYADIGTAHYRQLEDVVFSTATAGVSWGLSNPYLSYPVAGATALMLLPFTRRLLYRNTLGLMRNPQSVVRSCEGRVKGIGSKMEDYAKEVEKLKTRMSTAETEYNAGLAKLRSTRQELQRLSGALSKGERSATGVVAELRTLSPKVENVLQLRGEAANHAAALKSQRSRVDKWVRRIANMDI